MITYKYKLYTSKRNRRLDSLLSEACFVWNHSLALQRRYYAVYGKYVGGNRMKTHFAKRYKMQRLHSQSVQEVIERLDLAYRRFFDKVSKRPPKFKRAADFSSIVFKQGGFKLKGNRFTINKIGTTFKFSISRPMSGNVKRLSVKKSPLGDYYLCVVTDAEARRYGKTHDGASVGIDFGLKTYMTLSDGLVVDNPQFLKTNLSNLRSASRRVSRSKRDSNSRKAAVKALNCCYEKVVNTRTDWQWKTAHQVCRAYDNIFVEDLNLTGMCRRWGRKMHDLAHSRFVEILEVVAAKYGCTVHKIDRFYPSSKMCECGYKNDGLRLSDREWVCPQCGRVHDRDLNAARNILRRGIDELASTSKSADREVIGRCV
jgi:putative transposase